MKESTKPRIGRMLGDSPSRKMDKVELRSCEKIERSGTDSPFRAGQLRILKRLRGAKKVSGPGFPIFSQLPSAGTSFPLPQTRPRAYAWGYVGAVRLNTRTMIRVDWTGEYN